MTLFDLFIFAFAFVVVEGIVVRVLARRRGRSVPLFQAIWESYGAFADPRIRHAQAALIGATLIGFVASILIFATEDPTASGLWPACWALVFGPMLALGLLNDARYAYAEFAEKPATE